MLDQKAGSYKGSQMSGGNDGPTIQPSNFNFAPRTTPLAGGPPNTFGNTYMQSDMDFNERADDSDIEDDKTSYYSEEVTDEEAMQKQKEELGIGDETDDSDASGGYMPSIIQNSGTASKPKLKKITKRVKKKKPKKIITTNKKPPRGTTSASPPKGINSPNVQTRTQANQGILSDN